MKKYTPEDFGPNGEAVMELIEKIRNITPGQAEGLRTPLPGVAWDASWPAAWSTARDAAQHAGLSDAWHASWDAIWGVPWDTFAYVTWYAAIALLVRDLISEEHFSALYGPWASVMEAGQ